ncbi:MAG: LPS export ABC transporter periplasmic protein LptC [Chitinophagales bacterium]
MKRITYFLICSLLLFSCSNDLKKIKAFEDDGEAISEIGENVEILFSELGAVKVKILAEEMTRRFDDEALEFNDGLRVYFYNEEQKIESTLRANYGKIYDNQNEILVRDDVVVINVEGDKLNSEELIWKKADEKIYSDKFVKITTAEEIIYGTGFESNQDFTDYTIKNISGIISVDDENNNQ